MQAVRGELENGFENGERLVHHHVLVFVDLRRLNAGVVGVLEYIDRSPAGLPMESPVGMPTLSAAFGR